MPTSDEYRATAEECYRLAREATNETDRLACLDLARTWLEAASLRDQTTPTPAPWPTDEAAHLAPETTIEHEASHQKGRSRWRWLLEFFG